MRLVHSTVEKAKAKTPRYEAPLRHPRNSCSLLVPMPYVKTKTQLEKN